ncbi:dipeptidyl-peptidase-4 [Reichenbachiella faecimaris]|uniref:Dipeptidyl-peptidase-4 n=1 Tax=Reichenbachiella faecimaris TaxID=692418 RepID=A0A1W2GFC1_REIFA|nr:S9 family peptidase [Reichenbachiella faecimaris]SMD35224.1 dipeptidyl-peptidase-4 [Reichenbachiella faecimaris]
MKLNLSLLLLLISLATSAQKKLTVSAIYEKDLFQEETMKSLNWMNDGQYYTALEENKILRYDVTTGLPDSVIIDGKALNLKIDDYNFTPDESKLLLQTDKQKIYRRSFTAEYYIYSFKGEELKKLSPNGRQSYATISPDNKNVGFVRDNNLFFVKLANMSEHQVTKDGKKGSIINGSTDWVYEEELYITKAFFWSPNSEKLAYYRFDETDVKEYNIQFWDNGALYPRDYKYKYPKAGEKNSTVTIKVYNLKDNTTQVVDLGKETDIYIPNIQWTKDPDILAIKRLNRLQNQQDIFHYSTKFKSATNILTDKTKTYIHATYTNEWIYLDNGTHFLMSSEREGYKHFYIHRMDGQLEYKATSGAFNVEKLIALDQRSKTPVLYYTSTEGSSLDRQLYQVDYKGKGKLKLSTQSGVNTADMSRDFKYYISFNESASSPMKVSLMTTRGNKLVKVIKDNAKLKETVAVYGLTEKILFEIEAADKKLLNAYMVQPTDMDSTKKYPLLIYQYSGPGKQDVKNEWQGRHFMWHQLLAQKGYIVVGIDCRGTGGKSEEFKKMTYLKMGKMEAEDQVAAAKYLGTLPFVDKSRIGIWGWSYGGYISTLALETGPEVFKAGIAVSPFLWKYYDTIFSERYLRRPQDNLEGYNEYSIIRNAGKLRSEYLLIHGTGDDNVHFQNAVTLQNELINQGKQFDSFYYPDNNHSLVGKKTKVHLYTMMTNFLLEHL